MIESLPERIHCLGAGGAGMLPLALYLRAAGHRVSAEDDSFSRGSREMLEEHGVSIGGFREEEGIAIVFSSAISSSHPARAYAESNGLVC